MIIDSRLKLSDKQAITATAKSTNKVDFGQASPDLGNGHVPLYAVLTVNETFAGATSLTVALEHGDTEGGTFTVLLQSEAIPAAELKAGKQHVLTLPVRHKRFLQGAYTVGGTATAGKISLHIASGLQLNEPKPDSPRAWGGK